MRDDEYVYNVYLAAYSPPSQPIDINTTNYIHKTTFDNIPISTTKAWICLYKAFLPLKIGKKWPLIPAGQCPVGRSERRCWAIDPKMK